MAKATWSSGVRSYLSSWFPRLIWRKRRAKLRRTQVRSLTLERLESVEAVNSFYNPLSSSVGLAAGGLLASMQTSEARQRVVPPSTSSSSAVSDLAFAHNNTVTVAGGS